MLKITEENRDALLAYLLSRPMAEVENGVALLRNLEKTDEKVEEKPKEVSKAN